MSIKSCTNYYEYKKKRDEFLSSPLCFGDLENEIMFLERIIEIKKTLLKLIGTDHESEVYFFMSTMFKSYLKLYTTFSGEYALNAYNCDKNNVIYLANYLENIIFIDTYDVCIAKLKKIQSETLYKPTIELYIGLLKYINEIDDYNNHINYYIKHSSSQEKTIPINNYLETYCLDVNSTVLEFEKSKLYDLVPIQHNKLIGKNIVVSSSCTLSDFSNYFMYFLFTSHTFINEDNILIIIDVVTSTEIPEILLNKIMELNKYSDNLIICLNKTNEKNIIPLSSTINLERSKLLIEEYNVKCLLLNICSVFIQKINKLIEICGKNNLCTRELNKVYPWQKHSSGFIFFNNTELSKLILKYISFHLHKNMSLNQKNIYLDQNAIEAGIRFAKSKHDNLSISNILSIKDEYIICPTGNAKTKNIQMAKISNIKKYDNIVFFAHPDDETIFFWDFITKNSLLVLVTKSTPKRLSVLESVKCYFGCDLKCLNEPDNFRANELSDETKKSIISIITTNIYDNIITHNKDGEYGHVQHKTISNYITNLGAKTHNYNRILAGAQCRKDFYYYYKNVPGCDPKKLEEYKKNYDLVRTFNFDKYPEIDEVRKNFLLEYSKCHGNSENQYLWFCSMAKYAKKL